MASLPGHAQPHNGDTGTDAANGRIRIVCFDIGGVLVQHCRSWAEGCAAAGLPVRHGADCPEMVHRRRHLSHLLTCGEVDHQTFCLRMSETTGGLYSPEEINRIHHAWIGNEYDGIAEVIERLLSRSRVDTGILSNTNGAHWDRLMDDADMYVSPRLPRHRFASHLLGMAKPSPDIYREFSQRSGYKPSEVLFFEDLPDNIAAAEEAGWRGVLVDHTGDTAAQVAAALEAYELL